MNSHQKRKFMRHKHYTMPLGCDVIVTSPSGLSQRPAKLFKHDRTWIHQCLVRYENNDVDWVPLSRVKTVQRHRQPPWWSVTRIKKVH